MCIPYPSPYPPPYHGGGSVNTGHDTIYTYTYIFIYIYIYKCIGRGSSSGFAGLNVQAGRRTMQKNANKKRILLRTMLCALPTSTRLVLWKRTIVRFLIGFKRLNAFVEAAFHFHASSFLQENLGYEQVESVDEETGTAVKQWKFDAQSWHYRFLKQGALVAICVFCVGQICRYLQECMCRQEAGTAGCT